MEVKNAQTALLSNYEVLALLNDMKPSSKVPNQETSQLATIMYETSLYLQDLSCSQQDPLKIDRLLTMLKDFPIRLTKLEKLMICNTPPGSPLQLSLIVKDCDEKLSEEIIDQWVNRINEALS